MLAGVSVEVLDKITTLNYPDFPDSSKLKDELFGITGQLDFYLCKRWILCSFYNLIIAYNLLKIFITFATKHLHIWSLFYHFLCKGLHKPCIIEIIRSASRLRLLSSLIRFLSSAMPVRTVPSALMPFRRQNDLSHVATVTVV